MKKVCILLIGLITAVAACGCTPKTEYDGKEISRIETVCVSFMDEMFHHEDVRTFDFLAGKIYDNVIADPEDIAKWYSESDDTTRYNNPTEVGAFTEEQASKFLRSVKKLGFLAWGERYVTKDQVSDGGSETVTVYFTDGSVKSTYIFCEDPPKYEKIKSAFTSNLGKGLYWRQP